MDGVGTCIKSVLRRENGLRSAGAWHVKDKQKGNAAREETVRGTGGKR